MVLPPCHRRLVPIVGVRQAVNLMAQRWCRLYRATPAELAIEPYIAALGKTYRTQLPMFLWGGKYFPDVAIFGLAIILEIDDDSHRDPGKAAADAERTRELESEGWSVVRCTNVEALTTPLVVIARIQNLVASRGEKSIPLPPPAQHRKKKK